jgi:hypothetical protein
MLMTSDDYPELTKERVRELLMSAFSLTEETQATRYISKQVDEKLNDLWRYWEQNLISMQYPEFPNNAEPMINLRDIGDQGSITPQYNNQSFIQHLLTEQE